MRVPYDPTANRAAPVGQLAPLRADASPAEFGAIEGQALQGSGRALREAGDTFFNELLQWQAINNDSEAKDLSISAVESFGLAQNKLYGLQGKAAMDALPTYLEEIKTIRSDVLAKASNPTVRRALDSEIARRVSYAVVDGDRYVAGQQKVYANETSEARVKLAQETSLGVDQARFTENLGEIEKEVQAQKALHGWSDDVAKIQLGKAQGAAWSARLNYLALSNPQAALAEFKENKSKIDPNVAFALEGQLQQAMVTHGSRIVSDRATAGGEDYFANLRGKESSGDDAAKNPNSTAAGRYQFTNETFAAMKRKHPELNLTDKMDPAQQERAVRAFTADNAVVLRDAGIPSTGKNLYLAHFLGAEGAVRFIKGMEKNGDIPAKDLASAPAVAANKSVFFNTDGSPKTASQLYNDHTKKFGETLYGAARGDLSAQLDQGRRLAAEYMPESEYGVKAVEFREAVEQRIRTKNAVEVQRRRVDELNNVMTVQEKLYGDALPKSIDEIINDERAGPAYAAMTPKQQAQVRAEIERGNRREELAKQHEANAVTDEKLQKFNELRGLAEVDPREFVQQNIYELDLPISMKKELTKLQQTKLKVGGADPHVTTSLAMLKRNGVFNGTGLNPSDSRGVNDRYHKFVGGLTAIMQDYQRAYLKPMPEDEVKKAAASLLVAEHQSWVSKGLLRFEAPPPDAWLRDRATIELLNAARLKLGRAPTDEEIQQLYIRKRGKEAVAQ